MAETNEATGAARDAVWTAERLRLTKGQRRLACLTAYDFGSAQRLDRAGMEMILVGDSLGMTVLGYETTLPVTMEEMLHHVRAVVRGTRRALVVADMPFMSYQVSDEQALLNAGRFIKEGGAGAVKLEGGALRAPTIARLTRNGIPVLGHIGLTPQSIRALDGYRVQGREDAAAAALAQDAAALAEAGVFALVLECLPAALGAAITRQVAVPTIGIGAGPDCDGQVLVTPDMLGLTARVPKFARRYAELGAAMDDAVARYIDDVRAGRFPSASESYSA